jgi:hypothetical protein
MPQHVRGDNLGPVRQYTLAARERPRAGSHGDQDLRGLRPGSGRPCPGCRHGLLSRTECACASIAYGVRRPVRHRHTRTTSASAERRAQIIQLGSARPECGRRPAAMHSGGSARVLFDFRSY